MTDEEKAEEYAIGKAHEHYNFLFEENSGSPIDFAKLCYLDGLAEGRKELEKENKICEEIIIGEQQEINNLQKENAELKTQIEKMKCCYNCKYGRIYFVKEIIVDCLANKVNSNNKFNNCEKWELAE